MNISYKWLKEYVNTQMTPEELSAALTSVGLECGGIETVEAIRGGLKGMVVGKVLTCEPHPDSDHLHVTTVDLGGGVVEQIVCGAPNVAAGQTVIVATVGAVLYDGDKEFKIKKAPPALPPPNTTSLIATTCWRWTSPPIASTPPRTTAWPATWRRG